MTTSTPYTTLLFDILGTLLDEDAGMLDAAATITGPGDDALALSRSWSDRFDRAVDDVRAGRRPYATPEKLHAESLDAALADSTERPTEAVRSSAATFGHRLDPFAEVPEALDRLAMTLRLVGLTNAGISQAFEMSGHAGLRWTTLLSGERVAAFKPDPRV